MRSRLLAATGGGILLVAASLLTVTWSVPAGAAGASYGGSASGSLVALGAVNLPGTLNLVNAKVAPADAEVASDASLPGGVDAHARATNLDANLINNSIPINNLLVAATQTAPPDNATALTKQFLAVPVQPVLAATVGDGLAHARWLGNSCVPPGTPISQGTSMLATADVLTGTPLGSAAVSVNNNVGGPVTSDTRVGLVNVPGQPNKGVQSQAIDQLTTVILFKGTPNEVAVDVVAPPVITATATGVPGGATVTYDEPILRVSQGGKVLATLDAATVNQSFTIPGLATLSLGTLTKSVAADGTSASGTASLLSVQIGIAPLPLTVATLTVAGASAAAHVPAGGVACATTAILTPTNVTSPAVSAPPLPASPVAAPSQPATLPVTGGQPAAPVGLGLLVLSLIGAAWRRRRISPWPGRRPLT
jgi:hypothetical protein